MLRASLERWLRAELEDDGWRLARELVRDVDLFDRHIYTYLTYI
jgi:hypothetical protein